MNKVVTLIIFRRDDGRPKSNPQLETLIPTPSTGATSNNKNQQQTFEDAEFK